MTLGLFLLRAVQMGLDISDMMIESGNDSYPYKTVATQADFDKF